jgi:acyl-CoA thioester hydrolase
VGARSYTHRLRVRYSECDAQGVVFNGWYLFYYDVALTEFQRETLGPYSDLVASGLELVVAEANVRFRAAVRFDDWLDVSLQVSNLGRTSFGVAATFAVGERPVADAAVRHVLVGAESGTKADLPADMRAALEPYLDVGARR